MPSKCLMLPEKPITPTVAHTSADPGVFKQGKQDMPQKKEGIHLEEKILFPGKNEITTEALKISYWSARRQIPERYLITNSTGMSGTGFCLIFQSAR